MLHSTLPRAFLPPGLSYLGGYYGEDGHVYTNAAHYLPCHEDPYGMRIADPRIQLTNWDTRPVSPIPLDLSLKPATSGSLPDDTGNRPIDERVAIEDDAIEVDEDELRYPVNSSEYSSLETPASSQAYRSYLEVASKVTSGPPSHEDIHQTPKIQRYDPPGTKRETEDSSYVLQRENSQSGHHEYPGRKAQSPLDSGNYQQLLMTPQHHLQSHHAPMTPPSTPSPPQCPRRRQREEPDVTPASANSRHQNSSEKSRAKKKHARRLKFDEDTSSPVSGTVILGPDEAVVTGDIDPAFNIVEVTEEARAELAKIENRLGPYQCKLCRQLHEDAFQLAQHRCSRIAHVEYRCPECDKRFSCPANLASHRRWHKPRVPNPDNHQNNQTTRETEISCNRCDVKFTRAAALRKHLASQHPETNNNVPMANRNANDVSNFEDLNSTNIGKPVCGPLSINLSNVSIANEIP